LIYLQPYVCIIVNYKRKLIIDFKKYSSQKNINMMKHALSATKTTVKCGVGLGFTTVFIATMDDVIYSNLRKNIIMPLQMVGLKGS